MTHFISLQETINKQFEDIRTLHKGECITTNYSHWEWESKKMVAKLEDHIWEYKQNKSTFKQDQDKVSIKGGKMIHNKVVGQCIWWGGYL